MYANLEDVFSKLESEKERKELASIKKIARESAKKASLHNKKLRDCRIHYNSNEEDRLGTTLFITEGDSASGSITKARDVNESDTVIIITDMFYYVFGYDKYSDLTGEVAIRGTYCDLDPGSCALS